MNPYCNPLKLDIAPLRAEYDITKITALQMVISLDEINPEIKELLFNLGINVAWIELFYRQPGCGSIHADNLSGDFTKINWIYKGKDSCMRWFTINDPFKDKEVKLSTANTEFLRYSINEVTLAHSANIIGPALVQVGAPHLVINPVEDRYCLCFVLTDLQGKRLTMREAQHLLKTYIN